MPVIQPPGTQGAPQQETPNQIQITPALLSRQQCQPACCPTECPTYTWDAQPSQAPKVPEPQVLAAEVVVRSPEGELSEELQNEVTAPHPTRTNDNPFPTARRYQRDLCDGLFSDVRAQPEDTPWAWVTLWCSPTRFYVTSKCKPMQV